MGYVAISNPITFVYGSNTIVLTGTLAPDSPLDYTPVIAGANRRNFYGQSLGWERYRGHSLGLTWSDVTADTAGSLTHMAKYTGMLQGTGFDTAVFGNQYANWYVEPGSLDVQMTGYNAYSCSFQLMSDLVAAAGTGTGTTPPIIYVVASGGTETTVGTYKYHTFASTGTLTVTTGGTVEYLVVAGGGGGGGNRGGGGGAGGLLTGSFVLGTGAFVAVIGTAGAGGASGLKGVSGGISSFNSLTAYGGGGGGGNVANASGLSGASGGGAGHAGAGVQGTGVSGQGYAGGTCTATSAGGGGGATAVGYDAVGNTGGDGGPGLLVWGTTYATGGKGGNQLSGIGPDVVANTGFGGAGGVDNSKTGKPGATGVIIVRYEKEAE